jgi:hypothetical protein
MAGVAIVDRPKKGGKEKEFIKLLFSTVIQEEMSGVYLRVASIVKTIYL